MCSGALYRSIFCGAMFSLQYKHICLYCSNIFTFIHYLTILVSFSFYLMQYFLKLFKVAKLSTCIR